MSILKVPANERGFADYSWLKANYSFSFANYYNPQKMGFGALRVLNNDTISQGQGFQTHSHQDMEIITIPLFGSIAHQDSTGTNGIIETGEIQIMSAGTGISHSEFNASKTQNLELFQIWIIPEKNGLKPRYDQAKFDPKDRQNQWQVVISPNPEKHEQIPKTLQIFQQSYFSLADLGTDQSLVYNFYNQKNGENGVYLIVIEGQIEIAGTEFGPKDAAEIIDQNSFEIKSKTDAKILVIETL